MACPLRGSADPNSRAPLMLGLLAAATLAAGQWASAANAAPPASFDALAAQVLAQPQNVLLGNELRQLCRSRKIVESCIELFDRLVDSHPDVDAARYNAALAYVDNLPGHSLLTQGKLSTQSMVHVSAILERSPDDWFALYIRGLNNLYWPTWYRRTSRAVEDLSRCIRLSEALAAAQRKPYMALAYVALGDAYVKQEQLELARETWRRGVEAVGESKELRLRLGTPVATLPKLIDEIRSRDNPVDTDLQRILGAQRPS